MYTLALSELYTFFLCFARILGIFLIAPIFSNRVIFTQAKTTLAALLALFITPLVQEFLPNTIIMTQNAFLLHLFFELSVGLLIGASGYFLLNVLDFIGHIMGMESGLSNAQIFNPGLGQATPITSNVLLLSATVMLFSYHFHHTLIQVLIHSYEHIHVQNPSLFSDYYTVVVGGLYKMFTLGLQFSFPFLLIGLVLNLGIGLINKLIPQVQIFSVMPPAQLMVFFFMLIALLPTILDGFLNIQQDMMIFKNS
ncbi:MAG: Flagellar biosynthetic protein FliR [Holosporales bacterium]